MKSLLLFFFLINSSVLDAQKIGKWSGWQTYKCWPGIQYQLKLVQQLKSGEYEWYIQFRSTYPTEVGITWIMGAASDQEAIKNGAYVHEKTELISPHEVPDEHLFRLTDWVLVKSTNVFVEIKKMQFGGPNAAGAYAKCGSTKNDVPISQPAKKPIDPDAGLVATEVENTNKDVPQKQFDKKTQDRLKRVEHDILLNIKKNPEYFRIKNNRTAVIGDRG